MTISRPSRWQLGLAIAIAAHFLVIFMFGLSRHWGYLTSLNDLGVFDQAVWGTLHGKFLPNTSNPFNMPSNWLGFHFHPVLLLFVPLYAIAPAVEWFTLAQALALSLTAWPLFLLAHRVSRSEATALLWALAYLVNPFLLNAAAWDFHPVALAVPFIALGMLAIEKSDARLLLLSCLPLLFIQEQLGVTVAGFGLLWWAQNRTWKTALGLVCLGIAHAALVLGVIMPSFSPTAGHVMMASGAGHLSRYSWLGHSLGEVVNTLATKPLLVMKLVLVDLGGMAYLGLLFLLFIGLPLAAASFLLPGFADFAANMLSVNPMPRAIIAYHSVMLIPVLAAAAIHGARKFSAKTGRLSQAEVAGFVLIANLVGGYAAAPFPLPASLNRWEPARFLSRPDPTLHEVRAVLDESASVSAQANLGAHFSQRQAVYVYPNKVGAVDAIVLRLESPTTRLFPQNKGSIATLAHHLQMRPAYYLASIECVLHRKEYGVRLWSDPWLVLTRNDAALSHPGITLKIARLRTEWQIREEDYRQALQACETGEDDMAKILAALEEKAAASQQPGQKNE